MDKFCFAFLFKSNGFNLYFFVQKNDSIEPDIWWNIHVGVARPEHKIAYGCST